MSREEALRELKSKRYCPNWMRRQFLIFVGYTYAEAYDLVEEDLMMQQIEKEAAHVDSAPEFFEQAGVSRYSVEEAF